MGHTAPGLAPPPTLHGKANVCQKWHWCSWSLQVWSPPSWWSTASRRTTILSTLESFEDLTHSVGGDIFVLDDKTIYIQDFSHDGQAPDVFFWADGVIVPYITRNDLQPKIGLERFLPREDIVLLLPKEKPTIHSIERLEVWCRAFGISFGHIDFPDFAKK